MKRTLTKRFFLRETGVKNLENLREKLVMEEKT
jgi:hypothetical protein